MIPENDGWFVVNVQEAKWTESPDFGRRVMFEKDYRNDPFPHLGINLAILEPGKPACRYHRESAQEDFLVLSGECLLLINGEERKLKAWDFVHCPPGVSHVFLGAGSGPCVVLMVGARPEGHELFYPQHQLARRHGAEAPEPTADPRVAYRDVTPRAEIPPGKWPLV